MNDPWDVRGNLTGVSGGGSTISFTYDLFGRRLSKTVNGTSSGLKLWDGWLSANPFAGGEGANPVEYLNAQGSVERRKGTGGAADQTFSYAPYGAVTSAEPSPGTEVTASRWAGMEPDRADLYYARHRYYHPHIGRFISEDPIGLNGGMNLFAYVGGDPVNFIDPMGLDAWGIQGYTWAQYWNDVWAFGKGEFKVLAVSVGMGIAFCAAPGVMIPVAMGLLAYSIYKCGASKVGGDFVNGFKFWDAGSMGEAGERFGNVLSVFLPSFCFPEGTPVQMADGTTRPIEEVRAGDAVASRDTMTGRSVSARVLETSKRTAGELVTAALADPATGKVVETLRATPEHPFFVEGRGWVELGQVGVGSEIVTRAGPNLVVRSLSRERFGQGVAVYNFEVEGTHSYFVGEVLGGAWVHNACGPHNWGMLTPLQTIL